MVIPLTHYKNSGYTELKVLGVWHCFGWHVSGMTIIKQDLLRHIICHKRSVCFLRIYPTQII
ncbi:MAG: hypothetical protein E7493_02760 [Ruminococcus albus]|nr:hypothetical protein [Ruminococcus albus]